MEYNTSRNHLAIPEYGRNVQKMVEYLLTIEDENERQKNAEAIVELMGMLNPHLKMADDWKHKLWDHLFVISDFRLKVNSPYPIPSKEDYKKQAPKMSYPKSDPRYKHFGKNLERLIDKAISEEDPEKKNDLTQYIGNYMKLAYANWQREIVHDDLISAELKDMTDAQLKYVNDHTLELPNNIISSTNSNKRRNHSHRSGKNNKRHNNRRKNRSR